MNRFIYLFFLPFFTYAAPLKVDLVSDAAILINGETGAVLYEKNSKKIYFPASITKIATAYYALKTNKPRLHVPIRASQEAIASISEAAILRSEYTLPSHWVELGSTHASIHRGEIYSLEDLLYAVMLISANDASNIVAFYVGGTMSRFLADLNNDLKAIGCQNTHFKNPHGLHHPEHVSTAYDMALLAKEALKEPKFREIVKTVKYQRAKTNKSEATTFLQSNKLLRKGKYGYRHAIGVKTGYTSIAGFTLVAAAEKEGRTLIAVLLKAPSRDQTFVDAKKLFDAAFSEKKVKKNLVKANANKFAKELPGANRLLTTTTKEGITVELYPAEIPKIITTIQWNELTLPIFAGQYVGDINFNSENGDFNQTLPLFATTDVKLGWWTWFKQLFTGGK